jgi:hypothetical protein
MEAAVAPKAFIKMEVFACFASKIVKFAVMILHAANVISDLNIWIVIVSKATIKIMIHVKII